ncbi:hypothetical protein EST35_0092 [Pseudomonas phage vB_PaeM_PA5oct]|uniref:Uncharacterized protein n=1 Tax=Pseudomonas phage vB_PaeM_PA5oct TaxID=2163605 RepID=A0A4Y5JTJ0_9CAUD|nr:hypothetical protein PQE65_gp391 [Pseudomonas phage vB_PaeM_PA5oct]QCG75974.1 hypothetical protein EST35_0092 [Pseudomonas phage vB_PaeM_PA5oct]WPK39579.1 hypothetical protein Deiofobo_0382 [Pseudomonas phage Deifobo]
MDLIFGNIIVILICNYNKFLFTFKIKANSSCIASGTVLVY